MTFECVANKLARLVIVSIHMSICFLINCPDLVLMIPLSCEIVLSSIRVFVFLVFVHCLSLPYHTPHLMPLLFDCDLGAVHIACFDYHCCLSVH